MKEDINTQFLSKHSSLEAQQECIVIFVPNHFQLFKNQLHFEYSAIIVIFWLNSCLFEFPFMLAIFIADDFHASIFAASGDLPCLSIFQPQSLVVRRSKETDA